MFKNAWVNGWLCAAVLALLVSSGDLRAGALVLQSDFGTADGAVAAMKGVAVAVSPELPIYDLTHEIPPYNVWEAALRLEQTAVYWPPGTVFVSVVDPGVGSERLSVVLKTRSGHYFVTPDNGTLTFIADSLGVDAVREIDEAVNRRKDSAQSYTFHGRDVYAFTGARLAAGQITFEQVGRDLGTAVTRIPHQAAAYESGIVLGGIPILDVQYGNVWTNIDRATFQQLGIAIGEVLSVRIFSGDAEVAALEVPYHNTFSGVPIGQPLLYLNSLDNVALALNQGSFAEHFKVSSGPGWRVELRKP